MQFRSVSMFAGFVTAAMTGFGAPALADTYYLENWSADATIAGIPVSGRFIYDATTGGVVGNTTSIPGFCASGDCAFGFLSQAAVTLSSPGGASVEVHFNVPTIQTPGPHPMKFAINGLHSDVFGLPALVRHTTGGLNVSAVPLLLERWTAGASVGGVPVTGSFFYDPATRSVVQDTTNIPGFCAAGACGFSFLSDSAFTLSAQGHASVQVYFQDPTFGQIGGHLMRFGVNGDFPDAFGFPGRALHTTGGLDVLPPALAPGPAPGVGLGSFLALAGAIFGIRRVRGGSAARG